MLCLNNIFKVITEAHNLGYMLLVINYRLTTLLYTSTYFSFPWEFRVNEALAIFNDFGTVYFKNKTGMIKFVKVCFTLEINSLK